MSLTNHFLAIKYRKIAFLVMTLIVIARIFTGVFAPQFTGVMMVISFACAITLCVVVARDYVRAREEVAFLIASHHGQRVNSTSFESLAEVLSRDDAMIHTAYTIYRRESAAVNISMFMLFATTLLNVVA